MKKHKPELRQALIKGGIPSNLRLAYENLRKDISPGLIKILQKYANDPADEERWNEINKFLEKDMGDKEQCKTEK